MVCIYCGSDTHVTNSRTQKKINHVWRRRTCDVCGATFTTEELPDLMGSMRVRSAVDQKTPGEAFSRDMLFLSIYRALGHRDDAIEAAGVLCTTIISIVCKDLRDGIVYTSQVRHTTAQVLERFDAAAGVAYRAYHAGN